MLNNKGLVVSSVLYTLLIAFLLFLGVTLAQFSSSAKIISNSTKDLVNNNELKGNQVTILYSGKTCGIDYKWYQRYPTDENGNPDTNASPINSTTIVRIYSRYGTTFWPRDFVLGDSSQKQSTTNKLELIGCENQAGNHSWGTCYSGINSDGTLSDYGIISYLINNPSDSVIMKFYDPVVDPLQKDVKKVIIFGECVN